MTIVKKIKSIFGKKQRGFEAAKVSNLLNDCLTSSLSPNDELKGNLKRLRARSRDMAINNDYAKRYLNMVTTNVVGHSGIKLQVKARDTNGKLDSEGNRTVEEAWMVVKALEDFEKAWKPVHAISVNYVRSEVNPQFAAIVPPTDVVLVILFEVEMEGFSGTITVCIPYATVEPIMPKLRESFQSEQVEVDQAWMRRLRAQLMQAEVELVVELGKIIMSTRDLLKMKVGETIVLGNDVSDPLEVTVEEVKKYKGFPGVSRGAKAVQITDIIEREG